MLASTLLSLFALMAITRAQSAKFEMDSAEATVYYDLTNSLCGDASKGDPFPKDWAVTSGINNGIPICESYASPPRSLAGIGTNQIVAINWTLIHDDLANWCGKEVEIYQNGQKFEFTEGPLILWDACAAASTAQIVDLSAKAFTQLKGGKCSGGNPQGLTVKVPDINIWQPIGSDGTGGGDEGSTALSPTTSSNAVFPASSSSSPTTSVAPVEPSSSASAARDAQIDPDAQKHKTFTRIGDADAGNALMQVDNGPSASTAVAFSTSSPASSTAQSTSEPVSSTTLLATVHSASASPSSTNLATATTLAAVQKEKTAVAASVFTSSAVASAQTSYVGPSCTFGAWQCDGLNLEVCNYVTYNELGWETIETCGSVCKVGADGGGIDCE